MLPKRLMAFSLLLLTTACQQTQVRDEMSPYSRIPVGGSITVERKLVVPAGHSRVFIQHGKVVAKTKMDQYRPHCNFEIRRVSSGSDFIAPDTFMVTSIRADEESIVDG